jgi:hypothetical protein
MPHRLWFRLHEVLPLAEHAIACFTHRITGAQTVSGAPNGPALIWTGTATLDILTSNGVPVWYGENGTTHAAEAYTWRDTAGRYGTARTDGYDTAYLPLATIGGNPGPVMSLLRTARLSGLSWVPVDIDSADNHLIPPTRVHAVDHRDDIVPTAATWTPAEVTCRDLADQPYPALVADGYTSDSGHLLARFDQPTIERIIADLDTIHANPDRNSDPMPGEYPILRLSGDGLTVIEERDNGHATTGHVTDYLRPDGDGSYPLGAHLWRWRHTTSRPD